MWGSKLTVDIGQILASKDKMADFFEVRLSRSDRLGLKANGTLVLRISSGVERVEYISNHQLGLGLGKETMDR